MTITRNTQTEINIRKLYLAIERGDQIKAEALLNSDPSLVLFEFEDFQTPLHFALYKFNKTIINVVIEKLKMFRGTVALDGILNWIDMRGNTVLHRAAEWSDEKEFADIVDLLGEKVNVQARMINDDKDIPLILVRKYNSAEAEIEKVLIAITSPRTKKKLSKPIKIDQRIVDFGFKSSKERNLWFGAFAGTYTRTVIKEASTHPYCNELDYQDFENLIIKINSFRNEYDNALNSLGIIDDDQTNFEKLKLMSGSILKQGLGRCYEFSCLVMYTLLCMGYLGRIELFKITDADHVFVVIDRQGNDGADFTTWGENALVIDGLAGKVFFASKIPEKLNGFQYYNNDGIKCRRNIFIPFSEPVHKLAEHTRFRFSSAFFANNHTNLSFFSNEESNQIQRMQFLTKNRFYGK